MNRVKSTLAVPILAAAVTLMAIPVHAKTTVTFDTLAPGPPYFLSPQIITIGTARFAGGQVGFAVGDSRSNAYGLIHSSALDAFSRTITMDFSKPAGDVSFLLDNLKSGFYAGTGVFAISDDHGHKIYVQLPSPSAQYVTFPYPDVHQLTIAEIDINFLSAVPDFSYFQIDNVSYSTGPPEKVAVGLGVGPFVATTPTSSLDNLDQASASVPFGSPFFVSILRQQPDGSYKAVQATFKVTSSQPQFVGKRLGHWITNPVSLYPATTFFTFSPDLAAQTKVFMPIHLGAGWISIQPTDRPDAPVTVHVTVTAPASLGPTGRLPIGVDNNTTYDAIIVHLAHDRGLPPQYLKAQIEQETFEHGNYFNPMTWRYEPLSVDWGDPNGSTGNPHSVSFGNRAAASASDKPNLEQVNYAPHSNYRLTDGPGLCPGPIGGALNGTCPPDLDDIGPRYATKPSPLPFKVCRNGLVRALQPGDDPVTIREIISYNDPSFRWIFFHPDPFPGTFIPICGALPPGRRRPSAPPGSDPLSTKEAQTTLASSYGLLQMVHAYVLGGPLNWVGDGTGRENPSLLFDTAANLARDNIGSHADAGIDAGSLTLGINLDLYQYRRKNKIDFVTPTFGDFGDYETALENMFVGFNGDPNYGSQVLDRVDSYIAQPKVKVFSLPGCDVAVASQTDSAVIVPGESAALGVFVTAIGPVDYQWYVGQPGDTSLPIANATTNSVEVSPSSSTAYWVKVSTDCTQAVSSAIPVTVVTTHCEPPQVTTAPVASPSPDGMTLRASVGGAVVAFDWYGGVPPEVPGTIGSGKLFATTTVPTLTVRPSQSTSFWFVAKNSCGGAAVSGATTVPQCVAIRNQPRDITAVDGTSVVLSVDATGEGVTYQWYRGEAPSTTDPVIGAQASALTLNAIQSGTYWARVANACGIVNSTTAHLNVVPACSAPTILRSPTSATLNSGQSTTLDVSASGTAPFTYAWFEGSTGDTTRPVGTGLSTLVVGPVSTQYWVRVRNGCGYVDSAPAAITVTSCVAVHITQMTAPMSITPAQPILLSALATGTLPIEYAWFQGNLGDTNNPLAISTSSWTASPAVTTVFWVRATNACGVDAAATTITVASSCSLAFVNQPPSRTATVGAQVVISATVTADQPVSYLWFASTSGGEWMPVTGGESPSLTIDAETTTSFFLRASNGCTTINSDVATLTVIPPCVPPALTSAPQDVTTTPGAVAHLGAIASGSETLRYEWFVSTDGLSYSSAGSAAALDVVADIAPHYYFIRVTNDCGSVDSAQVTVKAACDPPYLIVMPRSTVINAGQSLTLSALAGGSSITYQWYAAPPGNTWSALPNETDSQLTVTPQNTTYYYAHISGACGEIDTQYVIITVLPAPLPCTTAPAIVTQPQPQSTTPGTQTSLAVIATGATSYQWYFSADSAAWAAIPGEIAASITVSPAANTYYIVTAINDCGAVDSNPALVTVAPVCELPQVTSMTDLVKFYPGAAISLSVVASGTDLRYQWYKSDPAGAPLQPLLNGTSASVVDFPQGDSILYQVVVSNDCGATYSPYASAFSLTACTIPRPVSLTPYDQTITAGQSAVITAVAEAQTALHYQWYESQLNLRQWSPIANTDSATITVTPLWDTMYYLDVSSACGTISMSSAIVRVQN